MKRAALLAQAFRLLAIPLHQPAQEDWQAICSGEWGLLLSRTVAQLGVDAAIPPSLGTRPLADALADYQLAFTGPTPVRPIESLYKEWTRDPSAELPLARERGWLGGDSATHMREIYNSLGIIIPPELNHAPDHLALELEFMALLLEQNLVEQAERFCSQHLDWISALRSEAVARQTPAFYQDLFALVELICRIRP